MGISPQLCFFGTLSLLFPGTHMPSDGRPHRRADLEETTMRTGLTRGGALLVAVLICTVSATRTSAEQRPFADLPHVRFPSGRSSVVFKHILIFFQQSPALEFFSPCFNGLKARVRDAHTIFPITSPPTAFRASIGPRKRTAVRAPRICRQRRWRWFWQSKHCVYRRMGPTTVERSSRVRAKEARLWFQHFTRDFAGSDGQTK